MRNQSTLFERICIAMLPDGISDDCYAMFICKVRSYLNNNFAGCDEVVNRNWNLNVSQDNPQFAPKIDGFELHESYSFWSSKYEENKSNEDIEWRILIERSRIVFNYRKHKLSDPGSFVSFLTFFQPILAKFKDFLGIKQWKSMSLSYFFIYDTKTLQDTGLVKDKPITNGIGGLYYDVRNLLVPFNTMPEFKGFEAFIPAYKWRQGWQQTVDNQRYLSSLVIEAGKVDDTLRITMSLDVAVEGSSNTPEIFEKMYEIIRDNYDMIICEDVKKIIGDDCK